MRVIVEAMGMRKCSASFLAHWMFSEMSSEVFSKISWSAKASCKGSLRVSDRKLLVGGKNLSGR